MGIWSRMTKLSSTAKFLSPRLRERDSQKANTRFSIGKLPPAYQKFYFEWREDGRPVHWIPRIENWERNPENGQVSVVRDRPIPVVYPHQSDLGLWGGEGVIDGLVKKGKYRSPVPRFWTPALKKSVVYSEILNTYFSVIVTERALKLIDASNGLDAYLITNPANELKSLLALKLKKNILLALANRDFAHDDPKKQSQVLEKYKDYLLPVDELEWYGLSVSEAIAKYSKEVEEIKAKSIQPLKAVLRQELIAKLKEEAAKSPEDTPPPSPSSSSTWLTKLNPFSKPERKVSA